VIKIVLSSNGTTSPLDTEIDMGVVGQFIAWCEVDGEEYLFEDVVWESTPAIGAFLLSEYTNPAAGGMSLAWDMEENPTTVGWYIPGEYELSVEGTCPPGVPAEVSSTIVINGIKVENTFAWVVSGTPPNILSPGSSTKSWINAVEAWSESSSISNAAFDLTLDIGSDITTAQVGGLQIAVSSNRIFTLADGSALVSMDATQALDNGGLNSPPIQDIVSIPGVFDFQDGPSTPISNCSTSSSGKTEIVSSLTWKDTYWFYLMVLSGDTTSGTPFWVPYSTFLAWSIQSQASFDSASSVWTITSESFQQNNIALTPDNLPAWNGQIPAMSQLSKDSSTGCLVPASST